MNRLEWKSVIILPAHTSGMANNAVMYGSMGVIAEILSYLYGGNCRDIVIFIYNSFVYFVYISYILFILYV